jgi:Protein N-terminal asparagine amidohydrolase
MVFQTSDSCNTLVSLDDYKRYSPEHDNESCKQQLVSYQKTNLLLPADLFDDDDDNDCYFADQHVYLPSSGDVDRYLRGVPQIMETADELLANAPILLDASCGKRILSVGQGELAHCTPEQADILVSDKATTCHIVFFKSTLDDSTLVSCTHLDSAGYESCVRGIISEHIAHHSRSSSNGGDEKKQDFVNSNKISMDIHILGGFEDEDARVISNWLLRLLGDLASEYQDDIAMRLQTCVTSLINDNGYGCPIGRGLAMNVRTGVVFLAKVDASVGGPLPLLRATRLWNGSKRLTLIHSSLSENVFISAFEYKPLAELALLLQLPDAILLQYTSTSPHVEEADFCTFIRSTLSFMNTTRCDAIFPSFKSLSFARVGSTNEWRPIV